MPSDVAKIFVLQICVCLTLALILAAGTCKLSQRREAPRFRGRRRHHCRASCLLQIIGSSGDRRCLASQPASRSIGS
jgi:hypothetical protein